MTAFDPQELEKIIQAVSLSNNTDAMPAYSWARAAKVLLAEVERLRELLNNRAGKLLLKGKFFLVVAYDEPYFQKVYKMIRRREIERGSWSSDDEFLYIEWCDKARRALEGKEVEK